MVIKCKFSRHIAAPGQPKLHGIAENGVNDSIK